MSCWRCGTCHKLILNANDANYHRSFLDHEAPYDDEAHDDELTIEEIQAKHKEAMLKFVIKRTG